MFLTQEIAYRWSSIRKKNILVYLGQNTGRHPFSIRYKAGEVENKLFPEDFTIKKN